MGLHRETVPEGALHLAISVRSKDTQGRQLTSMVAILVVAILMVLKGGKDRVWMRRFLDKARGNDLERSEAIIYKVGGCSQYMSQGGRAKAD